MESDESARIRYDVPMDMSGQAAPSDRPLPGPRGGRQGSRRRLIAAAFPILLLLAILAAYHNTLHAPFIFDDTTAIRDNTTIRRLWPIGAVLMPPGYGITVQGRPIINLSLAINYAISGLDVRGYHVLNLLVHLLTALTLFGIVRRTLRLPGLPEEFRRAADGLAAATALLWSLHPLQTESVTYLCQRAESIMGMFYLLTLYCVIRGATSIGPSRTRSVAWQIAAVAACGLGMASKEVAVTIPLIVLLYDRSFLSGSLAEALRRRRPLYVGLAATWVLAAILIIHAGSRGDSAGFGHGVSVWQYARTQLWAIVHYLRLSFWPAPLILDYGQENISDPRRVLPSAAVLVLLLSATAVALRRRPRLGFLGAWFFVILAPSSSVVPVVTQAVAEHRMYLPLAAVMVLVVIAVYQTWLRATTTRQGRRPKPGRPTDRGTPAAWMVPCLLVIGGSVALGGATFVRNREYGSGLAIWQDVVNKCPGNARAVSNLGQEFQLRGQLVAAIRFFDQAVTLKPDFADAWCNRGAARLDSGDPGRALDDFDAAIRLKPGYLHALDNRGVALVALGRLDDALRAYDEAIRLDPLFADAYYNRGNARGQKGDAAGAIEDYTKVVQINPDYASAYVNRGSVYYTRGDLDLAIGDFDSAIAADPGLALAFSNRASAYQLKGDNRRALADVTRALELDPRLAGAFITRAVIRYGLSDFAGALQDARSGQALGVAVDEKFLAELVRAAEAGGAINPVSGPSGGAGK